MDQIALPQIPNRILWWFQIFDFMQHIPVTFGASHYLSSKAEVTLIDHDRKSWKVNVCFCRQKNQIYHRLGKGWLDFCHDKMLKDGDVCTFELISEGKKAEMIINVQKKQVLQRLSLDWYSFIWCICESSRKLENFWISNLCLMKEINILENFFYQKPNRRMPDYHFFIYLWQQRK